MNSVAWKSRLETLGQRESGTARLEEAVKAFQNSLLERTREHDPLDWAMTQNNLGSENDPFGWVATQTVSEMRCRR